MFYMIRLKKVCAFRKKEIISTTILNVIFNYNAINMIIGYFSQFSTFFMKICFSLVNFSKLDKFNNTYIFSHSTWWYSTISSNCLSYFIYCQFKVVNEWFSISVATSRTPPTVGAPSLTGRFAEYSGGSKISRRFLARYWTSYAARFLRDRNVKPRTSYYAKLSHNFLSLFLNF